MTETPDKQTPARGDRQTPARGEDDRRTRTDPAQDPAPRSPAPDEEAVRKGQENLDSVTAK